MSMCRVFSCVVGRGCLLWPVRFLGKTLLIFALLHSTFQSQICLLLQLSLDFLLFHSSSLCWKGHLFFGVSSSRSCRFFIEPFNFSFFSITGWGIDLDYCDIAWFTLETNHSEMHASNQAIYSGVLANLRLLSSTKTLGIRLPDSVMV